MSHRRGFTIAELAFVLGTMAIIVSITVPTGEALLRRARADEAHAMLGAIHHAELQHFRDSGRYLACAATGEVPKSPRPFEASACWKALGVTPTGDVRFRYRVDLTANGFDVVAEGDLDADGIASEYRLEGRTQQLTIREALE